MSVIDVSELRSTDDHVKQCRICLDTENTNDMISPCLCTGTLAYVHRNCLNHWRSGNANGKAFKYCDLCQFKYIIETVVGDPKAERERLIKYHLYVLRDLLVIILLIQTIIVGLGSLLKLWDKNSENIKNLYPKFIHGFAVYYLSAFILLLAIIGFIALIIIFCVGSNISTPSFGGSNRNNHSKSNTDSPNAVFLAVVIMVVVCAIIGIFVGIVLSVIIFKKILKHHNERLWLRQQAEKYIVKDFQGRRHELETYRRNLSTHS
ncbi:hypothetical protein I4U23_015157 [Adineta vaga]|nr:hypothetical protein I4U23_015157 [Adineta vaga]